MAQIAGILRKNKNQGEWGSCNLYNGWSSCFESSAIKLFLCDSIKLNYRARINSKEGKIILGNYIGDSDSPELYCPAAGHYLILNFSENTLFLRSDPMGMRPLYYCEDDKSFYFSSNIKILSDISGFNLPDFSTIASILVMRYSMNERTEIKGVKRLKINEIISFKEGRISLKRLDRQSNVESDSLVSDLSATVSRLAQGKTISLGLSGGVDSRILLNVLLKSNVKFTAHTFGFGYEDDVKLAEQLSCALGIKNRRYHALPENKSAFIRDFLSHSPFAVSLHRTLLLNAFSLFSENQCVIDGTSGEFFRGHYFRRWKLARRFGLGDSMVFEAVSTPLPEFFNRDFASMCKDEAKINFIEFIREFRDQRVFEKDYDMAYVKYYNPNYRAREQSRMDESVVSFLPFHQSNLIYSFIRKGKNYFDFKEFSKEGIFREFPFATNSVVRPFEGCGNVFSLYEDEKIRDSILNLMHHSFFKTILSKNGVDSVYRFYEKSNMNDLARMDKISSFLLSSGLLYL